MQRTQIYLTTEQARQLKQISRQHRIPMAQVIRQMIDAALNIGDPEAEARAGILATAGILADAPDWPEWQRSVRGRTASQRLDDSGL